MTKEEIIKHFNEVMLMFGGEHKEAMQSAIDYLNNYSENQWIPIKAKELTEEEQEEYVEMGWDKGDITHEFICPLPDDGDEILISYNNGYVDTTIFCNDEYGVGDEDGNDWLYDICAWMPMPKGLKNK